jgi:hypothetical protein
MRAHWAELAHTGKIKELKTFSGIESGTNVYQGGAVVLEDRFTRLCTDLHNMPLGLDRGFWCVN